MKGANRETGRPMKLVVEATTAMDATDQAYESGMRVVDVLAVDHVHAAIVENKQPTIADERLDAGRMDEDEAVLWSGHASHVENLWYNIVAVLAIFAAMAIAFMAQPSQPWGGAPWITWVGVALFPLPFVGMIIRWLRTRTTRITLTNQRLRIGEGIIIRHTDEIELHRVRDSRSAVIHGVAGQVVATKPK